MKVGIDLGGSHIAIGLVKQDRVIEKIERNFTAEEKKNVEEVLTFFIPQALKKLLEQHPQEKISLVGMSSPGRFEEGCITKTTNLTIQSLPIEKLIRHVTNAPFLIENDGRCAALAEKKFGNLKEVKNGLFLCLGTGIGGACFIGGTMIPQIRKMGHMILHLGGKQCKCGKQGCFEAYCSMKAFRDTIRKIEKKEFLTSREIEELLQNQQKKEEYRSFLEEYITNLALGISNLANLLSPEKVVLGGSFCYFSSILMPLLQEKMKQEQFNKRIENVTIETAKFSNDAGIIGAASLEDRYYLGKIRV